MRKDFSYLAAMCVLALAAVCVLCTETAHAQTTIQVPADQPTIQGAINAAQAGDTVLVAPGTYAENLDFNGKAITVTSSDGPTVTIVDGGGIGPVATFKTNEGASSVLNGFTLQDGVPSHMFPATGTAGGGIWIYFASPTITNNMITGNHAICGIGIEIQGGSVVIRGNTITGNTQAGGTGGCGGGGIEVTGDSSHPPATPLIKGNTITNNSLLGGGFGGGIAANFFASPVIQSNYIAGNAVFNSGGGVFIQSSSAPVVVQNIIVNNSSGGGGSGGGIAVSSAAPVTNNTIVGNTAFDGSSGIFADRFGPITISNNLVVAASGQTGIVCSPFSSTFPVFSHNDVLSPGGGPAFSSNCASAAQGNGNLSVDPQFVNAANGDYHLQASSPAIDAGDNLAPNLPQQDYDGMTRVVDGNNDCVDTVDMGAYELQATAQASFSSLFVVLPDQLVNTTSSPFPVTLSSTGATCLKVAGLSMTGDFAQSNDCAATLPAGQSCLVDVTFTPTTTGTRTGVLTLTGNQSGGASEVDFSGNGVDPIASIAPSSLVFGTQLVNTSSAAQTVTLSNTGIGALQISSIGISGDFSESNNCPARLNGGTSCAIQVTFQPTATGTRSGSVLISSNSATPTPAISLSGTAVQPAISVNPASVAFGDQILNTTANQTVTVSNPGSAALHVSSISSFGTSELLVVSNDCQGAAGIAPGASCSIQIAFSPIVLGPASATLSITSDAPNSLTSVPLSGNGVAPTVSLSPPGLSFGNQFLNTTSTAQTVTLTNSGNAPLSISGISVSGDFTQSNNCPASLNAGTNCAIQVSFLPTAIGTRSGTLSIASNNLPTSVVPLSGIGINPEISVSPTSIAFGDQTVNTDAPLQTITVSNPGTTTLHVSSLAVSGDPDFFTLTNNCVGGTGVVPGGSCSIQVEFAPKSAGVGSATLTITSDAPTSPTNVALSGNGIDPIGSLSPSGLNFGNQLVNTSSAAQTVTLSNIGTDPLSIAGISVSGDFSQSNTCPASLAVGSSCTIQVTFHPTATGTRSGFLSISSNSAQSIPPDFVTGTGVDPEISVSPTSIAFGDQEVNTDAPSQTITVTNPGTTTLHVSSLTVSGDPDFFTLTNNCVGGTGVAPGGSCSIQVEFAPKSVGTGTATLTITSDALNSPVSVPLSGTGVNPQKASVSPSALSFGNLLVGTQSSAQSVTVSNTGGATLHISSLAVSGDPDFVILSNNCVGGTGVAPGGSCSIQVEFAPKSVGPGSATLTIASDDPGAPQQSAVLSGAGVDYALSAPASLSVRSGHQVQTSITVSALGGSFNNSVALSCSNLPTGASCAFSPSSVVPGATSASSGLTLSTQQSGGIKTRTGTYSFDVLGTSGNQVRSTTITLTVTN